MVIIALTIGELQPGLLDLDFVARNGPSDLKGGQSARVTHNFDASVTLAGEAIEVVGLSTFAEVVTIKIAIAFSADHTTSLAHKLLDAPIVKLEPGAKTSLCP